MTDEMQFSADFKKIKEEYLASIPEKLEDIKQLIEQLKTEPQAGDFILLHNHIHQIAGNASIFGFEGVANICKDYDLKLQNLLHSLSPDTMKRTVPELEELLKILYRLFKI